MAGSGDWLRVHLPDGRAGWLPASVTEDPERALGERTAAAADSVRAAPTSSAPAVEGLAEGTPLPVLGSWSGYLWVRTPAGARGWIADD